MHRVVLIALLMLAGCVDLSPQIRWQHAKELTSQAGWEKLSIPTDMFVLAAYVQKSIQSSEILTIYIEGDGLAWLSRSQVSVDPTPLNPVALEMALRHPAGAAAYLARPCQYVDAGNNKNCTSAFWTKNRFSIEVVNSANQAIGELKKRYGAGKLVLIGYSGGGAVAALVAARRNDVLQLITVAGNLDHRVWTSMHHVNPLEGSLNPADEWQVLSVIPQKHFVGEHDEVVGRSVAEAYVSRFPAENRPEMVVIPGFGHICCWVEQWPFIWKE